MALVGQTVAPVPKLSLAIAVYSQTAQKGATTTTTRESRRLAQHRDNVSLFTRLVASSSRSHTHITGRQTHKHTTLVLATGCMCARSAHWPPPFSLPNGSRQWPAPLGHAATTTLGSASPRARTGRSEGTNDRDRCAPVTHQPTSPAAIGHHGRIGCSSLPVSPYCDSRPLALYARPGGLSTPGCVSHAGGLFLRHDRTLWSKWFAMAQ